MTMTTQSDDNSSSDSSGQVSLKCE